MESWYLWWTGLTAAAVLNAAVWLVWGRHVVRRAARVAEQAAVTRHKLYWLVGFFVTGCLLRSLWSMHDAPQLFLAQAWVGRVVLGRLLATAADLAFAAQWARLLRRAGALPLSHALVPAIGALELGSSLAVTAIAA